MSELEAGKKMDKYKIKTMDEAKQFSQKVKSIDTPDEIDQKFYDEGKRPLMSKEEA